MTEVCRVLLVEDDPALAALLQEYLSEAAYDIELCMRGDSALELLNQERFDLVLSDIVLPGADGLSILQKVVSSYTPDQTLVLLMTGYSAIDNALVAVEQGAYDFVSKPFQLPEIRVRLGNASRYQQLLRKWKAVSHRDKEQASEYAADAQQRERSMKDRTAVRAYIRNEAVQS